MKTATTILILSCLLLNGCTIITYDRVFPKLTWYWASEAKQQRQDKAMEKANERRFATTNNVH